MSRRKFVLLAAILSLAVTPAIAQVKIGVLSGMSSLYADITGKGIVAAAPMAVEHFGPFSASRLKSFRPIIRTSPTSHPASRAPGTIPKAST